jgi:hypothetical protein
MVDNPTSFANNHCKVTHSGPNVFRKVTGWFSRNSNMLLPVSVPSSQVNQSSASSRGINSQAQGETITTTYSHRPPEAAEGLRILFGVPMGLKTLHVIPIPVTQQPGDKVFPLLQEQYRRIRGRWRAWFSFWQLSHCDFVKVCIFVLLHLLQLPLIPLVDTWLSSRALRTMLLLLAVRIYQKPTI